MAQNTETTVDGGNPKQENLGMLKKNSFKKKSEEKLPTSTGERQICSMNLNQQYQTA